MTFSGIYSGDIPRILVLLAILFTFNYLKLKEENLDSHFGEEKSKRLQDEVDQKYSGNKKIPFVILDTIYNCDICNFKKEKYRVFKNWTNPKSHRKYYSLMKGIYNSVPPFQPCEVVIFTLFGSKTFDYEWRLASFWDPEFWCLDVSALELAEDGLKWEETEKIVVCCQCCNSLTPDDIKRGESRHKNSCPFKRHKAQQTDVEDDHHVNCVRYILRSGQPWDQTIFKWTADAPNTEDSIPGNDYDIFVRNPDSVIEEPFIHVHPDTMNDPLPHLRNSPDGRHISNPIGRSSTYLLPGSDVIPGSNDETGLDEATGGAPPDE